MIEDRKRLCCCQSYICTYVNKLLLQTKLELMLSYMIDLLHWKLQFTCKMCKENNQLNKFYKCN